MVPHKDGLEIAAEIRESNTKVPIIFMTGTALDTINHLKGYDLNAVNYLGKPVIPQIVLAQIRSILQPMSVKKYSLHNVIIKIDNQILTINDEEFELRDKAIEVFTLLLNNINTVVKRKEIQTAVWKHSSRQLNNSLDSAISHIKKVLKPYPTIQIRTVYGIGYRLEEE